MVDASLPCAPSRLHLYRANLNLLAPVTDKQMMKLASNLDYISGATSWVTSLSPNSSAVWHAEQ